MKIIRRLMLSTLMIGVIFTQTLSFTYTNTYSDLERYHNIKPWYVEGMEEALEWRIIPTTFKNNSMDAPMTRGEFAEALVLSYARSMGNLPESWSTDVFKDSANVYALVANEMGFISGYTDGTFRAYDEIRREEMFVMIHKLIETFNGDLTVDVAEQSLMTFKDYESLSEWAKPAAAAMVNHQIVTGTDLGKIEPKAFISRAQAMVILTKALKVTEKSPVSSRKSDAALGKLMYQAYSNLQNKEDVSTPSEEPKPFNLDSIYDEPEKKEDSSPISRGGRRSFASLESLYTPEELMRMLGNNAIKYAAIFGDAETERYQTPEEALKHMVGVTVDVWSLNSNGSKTTTKRTVTVHRAIAETIRLVFKEIYEGPEQFPIKYLGGYAWRPSSTSEHRWGLAIDINSDENYMIRKDGTVVAGSFWLPGENPYSIKPDGDVVRAFKKYGFTWGGDAWPMSNDYMHFSFLGE